MKFYSTILIAALLFGLCLHERRAKEQDILNDTFQKDASEDFILKRNTYLNNVADGKFPATMEPGGSEMSFTSDTTQLTAPRFLHISLNSQYVSGN